MTTTNSPTWTPVLERKSQEEGGHVAPGVMMTPDLNEDYWEYRVMLSETQAIVGFPKFMTIGIGFAVEDDWNTNLPYTAGTEQIFNHIKHNKGDKRIKNAAVIEAIMMVQAAAREDRGGKV